MIKRKLKVLVSAYACEPGKGSEPGVGWNWVKQIAKRHEVWVLTRANNREPIERELKKNPMPTVHFVYLDLPYWMRFWKRGQRGIHLYYYLWQILAYIRARLLQRKIQFDLVHHVTFGVYWMPSFLIFLRVPFIFGPVGGAESTPRQFRKGLSIRSRLYESVRDLIRFWGRSLDPFIRTIMKQADLILARTQTTASIFPYSYCDKVVTMLETGMYADERIYSMANKKNENFIILSAGRLIHCKGFHLGIKAFAPFVKVFPQSSLIIAGDGPERQRLANVSKSCAVEDRVHLPGMLPHDQLMEQMASCDILLHPSLQDGGAWVVMEAMTLGKPIICLDLGGPGEMITEKCGIKIKAESQEQAVQDLAIALEELARNSKLRNRMGQAARKRFEEIYDWDRKGEQIERLYELVMRKEEQR